jgi:hypothetical protein
MSTFINMLNETSVTFIADLSIWWTDKTGSGFETCAYTGEVQVFDTYAKANQFRLDSIKESSNY